MEFSWQKVGDRKTPPKQYGSADGEANVSEDVGTLPRLNDEEMASIQKGEDLRFIAMPDSIHPHSDHREFVASLVSHSFPSWKTLFLVNPNKPEHCKTYA